IIGLLAAIAVPAYSRYQTTARMAEVLKIMNDMVEQSIAFSGTTGNFVDACDLNYQTDQTICNSTPEYLPSTVFPYVYTYGGTYAPVIQDQFGGCGRLGLVTVSLNAQELGFDSSVAANDASWGP